MAEIVPVLSPEQIAALKQLELPFEPPAPKREPANVTRINHTAETVKEPQEDL